jgi:hypothetical protein
VENKQAGVQSLYAVQHKGVSLLKISNQNQDAGVHMQKRQQKRGSLKRRKV